MADRAFFAGKAAMVIGGGRNIGRAIVLEFARRGARVAVGDVDLEGVAETVALVAALGGEAVGVDCDVTSEASIAAAVGQAEAALGPIHIAMNNAGILSGGNPEDIPLDAWERIMDVNFFGMVRSNAVFLPRMLARGGGHLVYTASFAGLYPFAASRIHYAASKAAVVSMAENLSLYLTPKGIGVSCLCPGPVMTTSIRGMKHYSEDYVMRGPGSSLVVKSQAETARLLAEGIGAGRVLIPTHDELYASLAAHAASPEDFLAAHRAAFAAGDVGRPSIVSPEAMAEARP
jgi:NAD(P)-dependent dehydrogenase (short-subunit alcohol dehydrogenase family)